MKTMRTTRVPEKITAPVRRLCKRIHVDAKAFYITVIPKPDSKIHDCFAVVDRKIKSAGGAVRFGWVVWFLPGIMMEGEFHVIWQSPDGDLIDVSPNPLNVDTILFIPDPKIKYTGKQVDNIRIPLNKNPMVHEFIKLAHKKFLVMNEGDLAYQVGEVAVNNNKITPIMQRMQQLANELKIG
ncbi:MAG: hypothetical protein L3J71_01110 [Victivallaceae bacterium]|nr:hypothetical protein [Victivallaceae bacterium]